jgi:hypothetical protein
VWYELPSFYVFHIANAWEEGGKVKMVACQAERVDLNAMKFNEDMGENMGVMFGVKLSVNLCGVEIFAGRDGQGMCLYVQVSFAVDCSSSTAVLQGRLGWQHVLCCS